MYFLKENEVYRIVITNLEFLTVNGDFGVKYSNQPNTNWAIYATDLGFVRKTASNQFITINGSPEFRIGLASDDASGAWYRMLKAPNAWSGYLIGND